MRMTPALVVVASVAAPCCAQFGLYAVNRRGELSSVDLASGTRSPLSSLGVETVGLALVDWQQLRLLSTDDRLHTVDPIAGRLLGSVQIRNRPAGSTLRAVESAFAHIGERLLVILTDASGADWLYDVNLTVPEYHPIGPTGLSGIRGFAVLDGGYTSEGVVITGLGQVYAINLDTAQTHFQTTLWPAGGPYGCIATGPGGLRPVATGVGLWAFDGGDPHTRWRVVQWQGFDDVVDMVDPSGGACYAECDTNTGIQVLDVFDFLCFQNRYAAEHPYACNCDQTTGVGRCDIFDFLCFQNAYDAGCR